MKKLSAYILLAASLTAASCKKVLDQAPQLDYDETKIFGDIDLTNQFLTDVYAFTFTRPGNFMDIGNSTTGAGTDELDNSFGGTPVEKYQNGSWSPSDNPDNNWEYTFGTIRKCNLILKNIDNVPNKHAGQATASDLTPRRIRGEIYFLRAWNYWELLKRYGGVPIVTQPLDAASEELRNTRRSSVDEVVNFILRDLDSCYNNEEIPLVWFGTDPVTGKELNRGNIGRATKTLVKALKSRMLLYYASPLHNPGNIKARWEAAADISKSLMDDGKYTLHNNYANIFLFSDNNEVILSSNRAAFSEAIADPAGMGWGGTNPTQDMVDKYNMANGKEITDNTSGYNPQDPYKNRDPRFYATINYHGAVHKNVTLSMLPGGNQDPAIGGDWSRTGYYMRKFQNAANQSGVRRFFPIVRLAEIYLNYAEALNEADGDMSEVYRVMNAIRRRGGIQEDLPAGLDKDQMRERIHNERAVELAFEKQRFWDARRWKKGPEILGSDVHGVRVTRDNAGALVFNYIRIEPRVFSEKMYLFPVPQAEIDKNPNILEQNEAWK
ncbi:RagB/SusD family nutrient uptake outer membrane protein [Chitinophaga sp.]|uniref:RagB/SusD family nutrient uptake outer membrane protein n=1 Tax=Chitinophaga sp. TaxID=1869181 RepID=UPI002633AE21|nr:RagB/SusD family nutrient uptake outer membrane protein [uncultured Chitinophaga sp.]